VRRFAQKQQIRNKTFTGGTAGAAASFSSF
jgi:hypothetical protein